MKFMGTVIAGCDIIHKKFGLVMVMTYLMKRLYLCLSSQVTGSSVALHCIRVYSTYTYHSNLVTSLFK